MSEFTLTELKEIMAETAGVDEEIELDGDIAEIEFVELGYDSLAVLELCSQVGRRYGVPFSDDAVCEMPTPARAVDYINNLLDKAGV